MKRNQNHQILDVDEFNLGQNNVVIRDQNDDQKKVNTISKATTWGDEEEKVVFNTVEQTSQFNTLDD